MTLSRVTVKMKQQLKQIRAKKYKALKYFETNPSAFLTKMCHMKPHPYNKIFLDCLDKYLIYRGGRQSGKSNTIAAFIMHRCVFAGYWFNPPPDRKNNDVLLCAFTLPQAQLIHKRILELMNLNPLLSSLIIRHNQKQIEIRDVFGRCKTTIHCVALGTSGDGTRGYSSSILFVDEFHSIPYGLVEPVLSTTAARPEAVTIYASTPKGAQGKFYDLCRMAKLGGAAIDKIYSKNKKAIWTQFCSLSKWNPYVTKQHLEEKQMSMRPEKYAQEYEAQFVGTGNFWYPRDVIHNAMSMERHELPTPRHVLGVDVAAFGKDETVFIVLETDGKRANIKHFESMDTSRQSEIHSKITKLHTKYNFLNTYIELNGMGVGICEDVKNSGIPIEPFIVSTQSKTNMHVNCLHLLDAGLLCLRIEGIDPEHRMIEQLCELRREKTKVGIVSVMKTPDVDDDWPAALALAAQILTNMTGFKVVKPELVARAVGRRKRTIFDVDSVDNHSAYAGQWDY